MKGFLLLQELKTCVPGKNCRGGELMNHSSNWLNMTLYHWLDSYLPSFYGTGKLYRHRVIFRFFGHINHLLIWNFKKQMSKNECFVFLELCCKSVKKWGKQLHAEPVDSLLGCVHVQFLSFFMHSYPCRCVSSKKKAVAAWTAKFRGRSKVMTMFVYYKICCFAFYGIGRLLIFSHFVFVCAGWG